MRTSTFATASGDGPLSKRDWSTWAIEHSGVGVGWRHILIGIQATQDHSVLLLPPVVHRTRSAVAGGVVLSPVKELGGNGLMVRQFSNDLDTDEPRVAYYPEGDQDTPQFEMTKGSSESFLIIAGATEGRLEWTLDTPLVVNGHEFTLPVNDGRPFATVGARGVEAKWWRFDARQWQPAEW